MPARFKRSCPALPRGCGPWRRPRLSRRPLRPVRSPAALWATAGAVCVVAEIVAVAEFGPARKADAGAPPASPPAAESAPAPQSPAPSVTLPPEPATQQVVASKAPARTPDPRPAAPLSTAPLPTDVPRPAAGAPAQSPQSAPAGVVQQPPQQAQLQVSALRRPVPISRRGGLRHRLIGSLSRNWRSAPTGFATRCRTCGAVNPRAGWGCAVTESKQPPDGRLHQTMPWPQTILPPLRTSCASCSSHAFQLDSPQSDGPPSITDAACPTL